MYSRFEGQLYNLLLTFLITLTELCNSLLEIYRIPNMSRVIDYASAQLLFIITVTRGLTVSFLLGFVVVWCLWLFWIFKVHLTFSSISFHLFPGQRMPTAYVVYQGALAVSKTAAHVRRPRGTYSQGKYKVNLWI